MAYNLRKRRCESGVEEGDMHYDRAASLLKGIKNY